MKRIAKWILGGLLVAEMLVAAFLLFVPYAPGLNTPAAWEGSTRGSLEALRQALKFYRSDHPRECPASLQILVGKYIVVIPTERIAKSSGTVTVFDGKGGWYLDPDKCEIHPNLAGNDGKGRPYTSW